MENDPFAAFMVDSLSRREPTQQGRRKLLFGLSGLMLVTGCGTASYEQLIANPRSYPASLNNPAYSREIADLQEILHLINAQFLEESQDSNEVAITNYTHWLERQTNVSVYDKGERFVAGPRDRRGIFAMAGGQELTVAHYESFYGVARSVVPIYRKISGSISHPAAQTCANTIDLIESRLEEYRFHPQIARMTGTRSEVEATGSVETKVEVPFVFQNQYGKFRLEESGVQNGVGTIDTFSIILSPREQLLAL